MKISFYNEDQMNKFTSILEDKPKLLSSHELLKISKPISYLSFIMKEIYDYENLKTADGISVSILRKIKIKNEQYAVRIENLKKLIKK